MNRGMAHRVDYTELEMKKLRKWPWYWHLATERIVIWTICSFNKNFSTTHNILGTILGTVLTEARKVTMKKIHFLLSRGLLLGGDKAKQEAITPDAIQYHVLWGHRIQTGTQHTLKGMINRSHTESDAYYRVL